MNASIVCAKLFAGDRPALLTAVVTTLLAVVVWVAVAVPGTAPLVQELDDSWRGLMAAREWAPFVVLAQVFALVGGVWVTVPFRIVVAIWLWQRRRWTRRLPSSGRGRLIRAAPQ